MQAGQRYDDTYELDGTLSFHRSRFVHASTDLWYTIFASYEDAEEERRRRDESLQNRTELHELLKQYPGAVEHELNRNQKVPHRRYLLEEDRRLREETVNYLDHPVFGLLIKITPMEFEMPELQETEVHIELP